MSNSITNNITTFYTSDIKNSQKTKEDSKEVLEDVASQKPELVIIDTYEKSEDKAVATMKKVNEIESEGKKQVEAFKNMLEKLFKKQGQAEEVAKFKINEGSEFFTTVDEETKAQATKDIEEGGYYSPEETSTRILDFAKSLAGGDINKLEILKKAVQSGFDEAAKVWGKEMPDITKQTYDLVMKGFEELKPKIVEDIKKAV